MYFVEVIVCSGAVGRATDWQFPRFESWLGIIVTYTCVPLSPSSIIWCQPRWVISSAGKVTAGLVEISGSL